VRSEVYKIKLDTRDELLGGSLVAAAAAHIKNREDQLSRTIHNLCTGVANNIEVSGGIFEHLAYKRPVKIKLTVSNFSFFITIHRVFVVDSNSTISVTIQNYTDVHMKFFLTITDTVTFQYIDIIS
jgi:hypothetical protein